MDDAIARARGAAVPASERERLTLEPVDYVDVHALAVAGAGAWSPEAWARAMFEDGRPLRERARLGLLGLLLSPPQPAGRVGGWNVDARGPGWVRLRSGGRLQHEQVVVRTDADGVALVTAVRYEHFLGRIVWSLTGVLHRRYAPRVLRRAQAGLARPP